MLLPVCRGLQHFLRLQGRHPIKYPLLLPMRKPQCIKFYIKPCSPIYYLPKKQLFDRGNSLLHRQSEGKRTKIIPHYTRQYHGILTLQGTFAPGAMARKRLQRIVSFSRLFGYYIGNHAGAPGNSREPNSTCRRYKKLRIQEVSEREEGAEVTDRRGDTEKSKILIPGDAKIEAKIGRQNKTNEKRGDIGNGQIQSIA